ncbi:MAG: hypothetical protein ABI618_04135 [Nitrospirota bacterium]
MGMRHACEADHAAAVASLPPEADRSPRPLRGHALGSGAYVDVVNLQFARLDVGKHHSRTIRAGLGTHGGCDASWVGNRRVPTDAKNPDSFSYPPTSQSTTPTSMRMGIPNLHTLTILAMTMPMALLIGHCWLA